MNGLNFALALLFCLLLVLQTRVAESMPTLTEQDPQSQTELENPVRFWSLTVAKTSLISGTMVALNHAWYKDYPRSGFHFHNDWPDWLQMDKAGHFAPAYQIHALSAASYRWAGIGPRRAAWYGAIVSTAFLGTVEILDGFSAEWGFSPYDMIANLMGSAWFIGQEYLWKEQKILVKWSHYPSGLADYRPDLLGRNLPERILKDYNGDTYWLSFNIAAFNNNLNVFPNWLNLALGYGAYGMLGGRNNPEHHDGIALPQLERYRQWYVSPDVDFSRIPTNSRILGGLFQVLNIIKFPAPALEYNRVEGIRFHWLFF